MSDREHLIRLSADASELKKATSEGAAGFNTLGEAGKQAGKDAAQGAAQVTSAAQAEANALRAAKDEAAAAAAARRAEEAAAAAARRAAADAMRQQQQAMRENRAEANLLKQANRQLAMQMTDVVTSVASGMPIWMVAIQQGGQIKDAYGGVGAALRGIAALVTPTVVGLGLLAVTGGVLAAAYFQGTAESKRFNDGMALTGNTAAITEGQFNGLVTTLAQARNVGAGAVRELLQVLAASGEQTSATLGASSRAALALARLNGQSAAENAKAFEGMGDSVANWAAKANRAYNYLTAEQYKQIMALEAQGRTSEAVKLNMEALASTLESRTAPSLGYLESALKSGSTWWSNFWDAAKGIGRAETIEDRIDRLREKVAGMDGWTRKGGYSGNTVYSDTQNELQQLQKEAALQSIRAADRAAAQQAEQDAILKASRQFQDSLAAIESAGSAKLLAEQVAGLDARKAATDRAYAQFAISGQTYRDRIVGIERERINAEEAAARKAVDIERGRVVKTEQEANARQAAVLAAQARLAELAGKRAKLEADIAAGRLDPKGREATETAQAAFRRGEVAGSDSQAQQLRDQAQATEALARAQAEYVRGLQQANAARALADSRDLGGRRLGDGAREAAGREAAITDQYNASVRQLREDLEGRRIGRAEHDARLAALRSYYGQALDAETAYQEARARIEADGNVGFDRALANYAEQSRNVAQQTERAWTSAFNGMEDGIINFALTGKSSFGALTQSILADLTRIYLRQQLTGIFSSMGGAAQWNIAASGTGATNANTMAGLFHGGGQVGTDQPAAMRMMPASTWASAPRLHTGRLAGNEYAAILQKDESVLTPGQMRQLAPAGKGGAPVQLNLQVINQTGQPVQATARQRGDGGIELLLTAAKQAVAGDIASGQGEISSALQGRYGLRPAMA